MTVGASFSPPHVAASTAPLLSQYPSSSSEPEPMSNWAQLLAWDRRVSHEFFRWYRDTEVLPKSFLILLEVSGHGLIWIIWPIALLLLSPNMGAEKLSNLFHFYLVGILDLMVVGILKPVFRRKRPSYNGGLQHATIDAIDQFSFPSGHATRSVSVAAFVFYVVSKRPGTLPGWIENPIFLAFTFVWGVVCAASRVALGRHHVLDVLVGAFLGILYIFAVDAIWLPNESVVQLWKSVKVAAGVHCNSSLLQCQ